MHSSADHLLLYDLHGRRRRTGLLYSAVFASSSFFVIYSVMVPLGGGLSWPTVSFERTSHKHKIMSYLIVVSYIIKYIANGLRGKHVISQNCFHLFAIQVII